MRRQFGAAIPRQRLHEAMWESADTASEGTNDGVCFLISQTHQYHETRLTLDQGRDERASSPFKEIALPMTRHSAILHFCGPLSNGNGVDNLPLSWASARARAGVPKVALTAQVIQQATPQDTATLHEQTAVDCFR